MFGSCYTNADSSSITAFDRPKYGCLNITGDIAGDQHGRSYGKLFIILRQHIRYRAIFYDQDTNCFARDKRTGGGLATCNYFAHVLNEYSDQDLTAAMDVASVSRIGGAASKTCDYIEVQIHGPVCLATDVEALSVPGRRKDARKELMASVLDFQKKTNCNIVWQEDLLNPVDSSLMNLLVAASS